MSESEDIAAAAAPDAGATGIMDSEDRLRPDFEQDVNALLLEGLHAIGKTDSLAHMAHPVIGGQHFCPGQRTSQV